MRGCFTSVSVLVLAAFSSFHTYTNAQAVQKAGLQLPDDAAATRDEVKQFFTDAFNSYAQFAYGHDDLARKSCFSFVNYLARCAFLTFAIFAAISKVRIWAI
jgi:hypothetical protein